MSNFTVYLPLYLGWGKRVLYNIAVIVYCNRALPQDYKVAVYEPGYGGWRMAGQVAAVQVKINFAAEVALRLADVVGWRVSVEVGAGS